MSSASFVSLKIFRDSRLLKIKIFTEDQISIGAGEGLSLQLEGIAPWHLLIERKHNLFSALDLGSETGTFLNGQLIQDETSLPSGSLIKIGPYEIQFFIGPPVESPPAGAPSRPVGVGPAVPPVVPVTPPRPTPVVPPRSVESSVAPPVVPVTPPRPAGVGPTVPPSVPVPPPRPAGVGPAVPPPVPVTPSRPAGVGPTVPPSVPVTPPRPAGVGPTVPPSVPVTPPRPTPVVPPRSVESPVAPPVVPAPPPRPAGVGPVVPPSVPVPPPRPAGVGPTVPPSVPVTPPRPTPVVPPRSVESPVAPPVVPVPPPRSAGVGPAVPPPVPVTPPRPAGVGPTVPPSVPVTPPRPAGVGPAVPPSVPAPPPRPPFVEQQLADQPERPKTVKPAGKGFWNTYAPQGKIKNLDDFLQPSVGNLIEVVVCWKERILSAFHFSGKGNIFIGANQDCQIRIPNMLSGDSYRLMNIASGAKIYFKKGVSGLLFRGKDRRTRSSHQIQGDQAVSLKPYEMLRMDFGPALRLYVRLMDKPPKPPFAGLLNLKMSEALALLLAFLMTGVLIFYGSLYAPVFLADDVKFIEEDIRVAQVVFKPQKKPTKTVKYDLGDKTKKASVSRKKTSPKKKRPVVKSIKRPKPKKRVVKKPPSTPRKGKQGAMAAQAPGKKPRKKKLTVGSVRPGGSLKTGKKGSSAKTVAPDPTKVGLLGAFGGGGKLARLDKGASGSGGLLGLAEQSTGFAGTEEAYGGQGIGTKTKELGGGGKGRSLVGISGIKTKGKGLGRAGSGRGGLGKRGRMNIEFGTDDIDVAGEIDREAILRVLRRNQPKFQRCYQLSLNEKPGAQGNLGMQWLISANGRGRAARAFKDPIGARSLSNCVAGILNGLNFPAPPSGQTPKVSFTFRFYL